MIASIIAIGINYCLNKEFVGVYGAAGIALASSIAAISQTIFLGLFLSKYLKLSWSAHQWITFFARYSLQLSICSALLWISYLSMYYLIQSIPLTIALPYITLTQYSFLKGFGIWFWVGPLCLIYLGLLYLTRKQFKIELSYFDHKQI